MRSLLSTLIVLCAVAACSREAPNTDSAAPPPAATVVPAKSVWQQNASTYRGQNGQRVPLVCSPSAILGSVWGTDLYTDDSSICTAAVHAGLITESGGAVTIEIRPGHDAYAGSQRNGIASKDYNSWGGSFVFVKDGKPIEPPAVQGRLATWSLNASGHQGVLGKPFQYTCPANGTFGSVWGTDVYTDDSSICTAAVHAGIITRDAGGPITIEMRGGEASYTGSVRNGVTSNDYGQWGSSFVFVK